MIRFSHVTKHLGGRKILDNLSFEVEKGETFILLGGSGTGKSVTLKHMVRLMTPDTGEVWIGDDCISTATGKDLSNIRMRFGYLFQGSALLQWLTARDNIGMPLREHTNKTQDEIDDIVMDKLKMVELEDAAEKYPSEMSGGMRKRIALARAIVMNPEIILYDEPTSGLDPATARHIDRLIDTLRDRLGITSVVVTHDLHSALKIGTRIAMLDKGKVVALETPQDFVHSSNGYVKHFLASQFITPEVYDQIVGTA